MSPARSKRTPIPQRRDRADVILAAGVAASIIVVTALLVWLMRPGPQGTLGTGGIMNRQPRASWLVGAAIGVAAVAIWWILRVSRRARDRVKVVLPVTLGVIVIIAVAAGFAWPGGVLRHDVAPPPTTTTTTTTGVTTTTAATTTSGGAPTTVTTGPSGATGATSTSNAGGTSPTTSPATTTTTGPPTNPSR